jgi:hypothetical protein
VRFAPENVSPEADEDLYASAEVTAVTKTDTSFVVAVATDVLMVNPVTATPVVELATGVMVTAPLPMFGAENIPVPVIFAKVTSLVVATACPIDTTAAPALTPDPVIVTPVDPVAVAMKLPVVILLVLCVWMSEA